MARLSCGEMVNRVADARLQIREGYGYIEEYDIARAWRHARLNSIAGGNSETRLTVPKPTCSMRFRNGTVADASPRRTRPRALFLAPVRPRSCNHRAEVMMTFASLILSAGFLAAGPPPAAGSEVAPAPVSAPAWTQWKGKTGRPRFPADLGSATIDVAAYPEPLRKTYRTRFQTVCSSCHSLARVVNSEILELSPLELAELRKVTPGIGSHPKIWKVGPSVWYDYLVELKMRPPCCGACPVMTRHDVQRILDFLTYDAKVRKTGKNAGLWEDKRTRLIEQFEKANPERYEELYGSREGASLP